MRLGLVSIALLVIGLIKRRCLYSFRGKKNYLPVQYLANIGLS